MIIPMFSSRIHSLRFRTFVLAACLLITQALLLIHATHHALHPEDSATCELCIAASASGAGLVSTVTTAPVSPGIVETPIHQAFRPITSFFFSSYARAPPVLAP